MRTKQVRPDKLEFEYELFIYRETDEILRKDFVAFDFRTKKIFENFAYKINVIHSISLDKKEISFNIEGLSAPLLDFSKAGPASYIFRLFDFQKAEYKLMISKYRKSKTIFGFKINDKGIHLTHDPEKKFIKVMTEESFVS
jgi:hypothetical protein